MKELALSNLIVKNYYDKLTDEFEVIKSNLKMSKIPPCNPGKERREEKPGKTPVKV